MSPDSRPNTKHHWITITIFNRGAITKQIKQVQNKNTKFQIDLELGEGQFIEFKSSLDKNMPREMVAFANASGGVIYLGINDKGQ